MSEIEKYIESIVQMDVFADVVIILDEKGVIKYSKTYREMEGTLKDEEIVGKNILEVYPNRTKENSTIYKALKGIPTYQMMTEETYADGRTITMMECDFPVKKGERIIGALSTGKFIGAFKSASDAQKRREGRSAELENIIGETDVIEELKEQIVFLGQTPSAVLIYGETGTGKELVAQAIHSSGKRSEKPFYVQNCAAIPGPLLESIFFGTVKGSYTGAVDRAGIFERANGGTVFLDEINSMDYQLQSKLLRVLENKKVTRLGDVKEIPVDVRILAATNEKPLKCIQDGMLREDLYYRLSTVRVNIPPMRERLEDLDILCRHFIDIYNKEMGKLILGISVEALDCLKDYPWPGNVRELKNIIEGIFNYKERGIIEKDDLPHYIRGEEPFTLVGNIAAEKNVETSAVRVEEEGPKDMTLKQAVEEFEKSYIQEKAQGCRNYAMLAEKLGITPQGLNYKMKKYKIDFK